MDSDGQSLEFLLSPTRDAEAAKRFFCKALHTSASSAPQTGLIEELVAPAETTTSTILTPRVINVDKNAASPKAIAERKAAGRIPEAVELRQVK